MPQHGRLAAWIMDYRLCNLCAAALTSELRHLVAQYSPCISLSAWTMDYRLYYL